MAARPRKHDESYERYRKNLRAEERQLRVRLKYGRGFVKIVQPRVPGPSLNAGVRARLIDGTLRGPFGPPYNR